MFRKLLFFIAVSLILFGAGSWAGFYVRDEFEHPFSFSSRVKTQIGSFINSTFRQAAVDERVIVTNRLSLRERTSFLPTETIGRGGGLTSVNGEVLLLVNRDGQIFEIEEQQSQSLNIVPPDRGAAELQAQYDAGRFGEATIDFRNFRFNDILYLETEDAGHLLLSYTDWDAENFCQRSTLARLDVPLGSVPSEWQAQAEDWQIVRHTEPCLDPMAFSRALRGDEAGGRLIADAGSQVFWTSGAYHRDDHVRDDYSQGLGQRDDNDYGKILRVDIFTGAREIVARGMRNPQGIARTNDGQVWATDHGMRGGDELNMVTEGANFGYPVVTYGTRYTGRPANREFHTGHGAFDHPVMAFVPAIAPGSLVALQDFDPVWNGDLLIGGLISRSIFRVHVVDGRGAFAEQIELGVRVRDMQELNGNRVALWTDDRRIVYLSPEQGTDPIAEAYIQIDRLQPEALRLAVDSTMETCLQCHGLAANDHRGGPSLHGICGNAPGSVAGYEGYSGAFAAMGGVWDTDRLAAFLADPEAVAPGNGMAWSGIDDPAVTGAVAELLCPSET